MDHRPSRTAAGVPPWARAIPAARLLAPCPTRPRSRTTTLATPPDRANTEAHPPIVPPPTAMGAAGLEQSARQPQRVRHDDVVVGDPMDQEQRALYPRGVAHQRVLLVHL